MADLNLDLDEGILITTNGVKCTGNDSRERVLEMHLTNKNIIYVTSHREKTGGMFSKSVNIEDVQKVPLSSIKVINGRVMVTKEKIDLFEYELQIQFVHGMERYSFLEGSKKISSQWVNELNRLLGTEQPAQKPTSHNKGDILGLSGIASSFKGMAGTFRQSASSTAKPAADSVNKMNSEKQTYMQAERKAPGQAFQGFPQSQPNQQSSEGGFCINCGTQLPPGTRFCPRCGSPVNGPVGQTPPSIPQMQPNQAYPPQMQPTQPYPQTQPAQPYPQMHSLQGYPQMQPNQTNTYGNSETRRQEFAGKIVKCPNCGESIGYMDIICPSCGMEITGRSGSSSVQRIQEELLAIENSRKQRTALGNLITKNIDDEAITSKKVTLIKSFPIPNTIEEISEFVVLAASSIDVRLSKVSLGNKWARSEPDYKANERSISDAWVGKLQQAYQKAELSFSDRPIFQKIQQIYADKMKELNMKAKK